MSITKPNVLIIAGHDPSGGAGLHADIEAITHLGCHAASVVSCHTLQDSRNAKAVWPCDTTHIIQQLALLVDDLSFSAIKLGLLGTPRIATAVADFIHTHLPKLPLVVDPVLVASGGSELAVKEIIHTYQKKIFPLATVITPNTHERNALTESPQRKQQVIELLATGTKSVLLKGGDDETENVINTLYTNDGSEQELVWSRFDGNFHGSGCTLASAIAANLAAQQSIIDAVTNAQSYTWKAIKKAYRPGQGQHVPNRQFSN